MKEGVYSIDLETWGSHPRPPDALDDLAVRLEELGAMSAVSSAGGTAGGPGATLSLRASDAPGAARAAVDLFTSACEELAITHRGIARVDVMTDGFLDLWLDRENETFVGSREVAELLGVSRQRMSELRLKPGFPAPVAELAAGPVWKESSLRLFLEGWERKPGRPRRAASA